jgi:Uma2 family endonuclease
MASPTVAPAKVHYPSSDGKPMAESDFQRTPLSYAVERLRHHFRDRRDVYVSGNLLLYYEEGNPGASVAPDVFVVLGVSNADRPIYRLWEEAKEPDFVLEITSRTTYREDQGRKRELYRSLGVREYWQYDPTRDYLEPPLQGLELNAGEYRRLPGRELADGTLALASAVLGLELRLTERGLRFHDPETDRHLPTHAEISAAQRQAETERQHAEAKRQQAEAERQQERTARRQAETRIAELEALLRERDAGSP